MTAARNRVEKSATAFRSIGEAAAELGLETHVLRYWESKFPRDVKPVKRADGRRLFRPQDLEALRAIQILVHERGMTLKGAKSILAEQGLAAVLSGAAKLGTAASPARSCRRRSPKRSMPSCRR
jgi:DNA-binding transcriptional MerR regulator